MRLLTWNIHGARDAPLGDIAAEIQAQTADVVCLNEVRRRHVRRLGAILRMRAYNAVCVVGPFGNTIFTNEPMVRFRRCRFAGARRTQRRDAALLTLRSGLTVAAIHLNLDPAERLRHVAELLDSIRDPAVVAGDLNELPDGPVTKALGRGLGDAGAAAGPTHSRGRIDAIWISAGIAATHARVVESTASDHRLLVADLDA